MSTDKLLENIWVEQGEKTPDTPEAKVEEALERALKATTPGRPGCPWDDLEEDHERERPGWVLPEGD